jgi:predicted PurR-regulated permease PerM
MSELPQKTTTYRVDITPRSFLVVALGVITIAALWVIRDFVLLVVIAVIVASFVTAGTKLLQKIKIPRSAGVTLMYLFFIGIIALIIFVFLPLLFRELSGVIDYLPKTSPWAKLLNRVSDNGLNQATLRSVLGTSNLFQGIQNFWKVYLTDSVLSGINTIFHAITNVVLVFIMSFFLSIKEGGINSFLRALTPIQYESYVVSLWDRVEEKIGFWFGGQFLLALLAGVVTFIGLSFIGVPYVLLLSILVTILELIPFGLTLGTLIIVPFIMVSQGVSLFHRIPFALGSTRDLGGHRGHEHGQRHPFCGRRGALLLPFGRDQRQRCAFCPTGGNFRWGQHPVAVLCVALRGGAVHHRGVYDRPLLAHPQRWVFGGALGRRSTREKTGSVAEPGGARIHRGGPSLDFPYGVVDPAERAPGRVGQRHGDAQSVQSALVFPGSPRVVGLF